MADKMYTYEYPHPAVTTDCVIFSFDSSDGLSVLLVQRGGDPYKGFWAFPGGFMEINEDAETGARRELMEETCLDVVSIEQIGCFTDVDRDPRERVISIAYMALVRKTEVRAADDAADARWFPVSSVPPLAFDHDRILKSALRRLKETMYFRPVCFDLLPEVFTMSQLQSLYESILEVNFDRQELASRMLKLGIIQETETRDKDADSRTCFNYSFNKEKYDEMKSEGFKVEF